MYRHALNKVARLLTLATAVVALGLLAGCHVEVDGSSDFYADLKVDWHIDGSDDPSLCGFYGIESWVVAVSGPDSRAVEVDCRAHYWSSESDLLALREGSYTVSVSALDVFGDRIVTLSDGYAAIDAGYVDQLTFAFTDSDF